MKTAEPHPNTWLQFQKTDHKFTIIRTGAYGGSVSGSPITVGSWHELAIKLERAGFTPNAISVLKERLDDHAVAVVGPVSLTIEQLAVLGIQQAA